MQRRWMLTIAVVVGLSGVGAVRYGGAKLPRYPRAAAVPEPTFSQAAYRYQRAQPGHWRDFMLQK